MFLNLPSLDFLTPPELFSFSETYVKEIYKIDLSFTSQHISKEVKHVGMRSEKFNT